MSKRFKRQDYFRYKKLGIKWRRAKGRQSKMRLGKGGSGMKPGPGYRSIRQERHLVRGLVPVIAGNENDLGSLSEKHGIIISGSVGAKKAVAIAAAAKEKGIRILNMKKLKRAARKQKEMEGRKKTAAAGRNVPAKAESSSENRKE